MTEKPLLEINDLHVSFHTEHRRNHVLKGIDLTIRKGEIVGMVGESGSGKSVTGLSLLGLLPDKTAQVEGSISYNGTGQELMLNKLSDKEFLKIRGRSISMIFQEPMSSLNPVFTCGYQVDEMFMVHKDLTRREARSRTNSLFEKVGLPDPERIYKSYPHQISGGQIQRVMIAMALSCEPQLLIADEPTTALDVTIQKKILGLLKSLNEELGLAILFISHDLGVIKEIADTIYVMYRGTICETGPTQSVLNNPTHPYTQGLLACKPPLTRKLDRLPVISDYVNIKEVDGNFLFTPAETKPFHTNQEPDNIHPSSPVMLSVKNLSVRYPIQKGFFGNPTNWLHALNNVSFELKKGKTLGIVGESGSGKSTLGRTLVNLEHPYSGQAILEGRNLFDQTPSQWRETARSIQIIFQDPYSSLNPKMYIGDAIIEPMTVHGIKQNRAAREAFMFELLDKTGLQPEHAWRYPHEFSGGQRQRISIARALALQPQVLICDESVAALDVSVQAQVLNLLKQLQTEMGLAIIFITHDMSVVNFIADEIMVLHKGEIVESGPTLQIVHHPTMPYTQSLISAIPVW